MRRRLIHTAAITCLSGLFNVVSAQRLPELHRPLDIPLTLSANFAELRPNHFHSGLDFKTESRTGLPVRSVADGYVSSIEVSPVGFGRAVYVTHPSLGLTTVYGHLEAFSPKIDKIVRDEQYRRETFSIDMEFIPGSVPVRGGEVIGLSGNAGSSGGPHLHFDIRETAGGDPLDPMPYFKEYITDREPPYVKGVALYPAEGKGTVDGKSTPSYKKAGAVFYAWGKVYPAVDANDAMTGTSNVYGVKHLALYVDGKCVFGRTLERFPLGRTRAINTLVNYDDLVRTGRWWQWTRIPASRPLPGIIGATVADGAVIIDRERDYKCVYVLMDEHGNRREVRFTIRGVKNVYPARPEGNLFRWNGDNSWRVSGLKVLFPRGCLYDDFYFKASRVDKRMPDGLYSGVYSIGLKHTPLASSFDVEIRLERDDVADKSKYCLVRMVDGGGMVSVGGRYADGVMRGEVSRFGRYAVAVDGTPPKILAENQDDWGRTGVVNFIIGDDLSGVATFRGEIDGKFALFEYDRKNNRLSFKMDSLRFTRGREHSVTMTVTDATGNVSRHVGRFNW